MDVKLVAVRQSGVHPVGHNVTHPDHIEDAMSGPLRKRYVRAAVHPGDMPFVPVLSDGAEAVAEAAPQVEAE